MVGCITAAVSAGTGRHALTLHATDVEHATLLTLIDLALGAVSFTLTKVAVVILLVNLLHPSLWHIRLLWMLVLGNILFILVTAVVFFFQCNPPQALWIVEMEGECWSPVIADCFAISGSGKTSCVSSTLSAPDVRDSHMVG